MVRNTLRVLHRHSGDESFPPAVLAWETLRKVTLAAPRVASEASKAKSWTSVKDAIKSTPGASPPRLGGRTWRDELTPASVRDRLSPTRKEKLLV